MTFLVARMKRQFMQSMRKTGAIEIMGGESFFSRLTFALAYAWTDMKCDKCDNGKRCPYRVSVAKQEYEERMGATVEELGAGRPVGSGDDEAVKTSA